MTIEIITCQQGTQEWLEARMGIVTASEMNSVMANGRNGEPSKTRALYMRRLAAEIITGRPCAYFEGNEDTERGKELEPVIADLYSQSNSQIVTDVGFIKNGRIGCSPDRLIGEDGGLEIKSKRPYIQIEILEKGDVPTEYLKQIQTCLKVTEREWWDFVCHSEGLPLFTKRVYRNEKLIMDIEAATDLFNEELDELVERLKKLY